MKRFLICGIVILFALTTCEQAQDGGGTGVLDGANTGTGTETTLFKITASGTGALTRGGTRQFTVNPKYDVIWTVEGANPDGGTTITGLTATRGRLKVGAEETSRTFTVKATSIENPQACHTVTVTVDGLPAVWTELTDNLADLITNKTNGWKEFVVTVSTVSHGIKVLAYGEGVGPGNGRWVVGGGSGYHPSVTSIWGYHYPVMAYSDDDGQTWTEIHTTPALAYEELPECLIYDGPAGDKKFVLSTYRGSVFWSVDGITWTKVQPVLPGYNGNADGINPLDQVIYGDIDANGGKGRYLVLGTNGRFTWSDDGGKTWKVHYASTDWKYVADCNGIDIRYGTGVIGNNRVKMFFGAGYKGSRTNEVHCYSLDGIEWVTLDEANVAALAFEPVPPAGANRDLSWLDETDTSTLHFAPDTAVYEFQGQTGTLTEHEGVNKHADFVAYGNGKYLAVGKGRRLARTDAETARKK
jgi:hypothetical protein